MLKDLSVIVPIYNVDEYLEECLRSIQEALVSGFSAEVICVNDGSQDRSCEIAESFAESDPRFVVITQPNGGYGKAINTGMRAATGEFVTIVESDDKITPDAYLRLIEILKRESRVDFVKTPYQPFTQDGPLAQMAVPPDALKAADILAAPKGAIKPQRFTDNDLIFTPPAIWAGVYRRSSIRKHAITMPETPGAGYQDTAFSALCFLSGMTFFWLDDRYYMYRVDRETASRHVRNRKDEIVGIFRFVRRNLAGGKELASDEAVYFFATYFRRLIWFMDRVHPSHQFACFLDAYRCFEDVWEAPEMREKVRGLLPGHEKQRFDDFFQGRHRRLYSG